MPDPYMTIEMAIDDVKYVQNYFNQNDSANTSKICCLEYTCEAPKQ